MKIRTITLVALAVLGLAAQAEAAAVLTTPPMAGGIASANGHICIALNSSSKPVDVTVEIVNAGSGTVSSSIPVTLDPMTRYALVSGGASTTTYCRVIGLSKKSGSVSLFLMSTTNDILSTVTAP